MKGEAMDEIRIIYFNNGMVIIGKPEYGVNVDISRLIRIVSPRAVVAAQDANGRVGLQITKLYGKPDEIDVLDTPLFIAEVKDKEMRQTYLEETTSLHLAS